MTFQVVLYLMKNVLFIIHTKFHQKLVYNQMCAGMKLAKLLESHRVKRRRIYVLKDTTF